jgi:heme O synthase-like polyprenyltransferase
MTEASLSDLTDTGKSLTAAPPAGWADYVALLKPRVMSLVVFTGLTGLVCADQPMNPIMAAVRRAQHGL